MCQIVRKAAQEQQKCWWKHQWQRVDSCERVHRRGVESPTSLIPFTPKLPYGAWAYIPAVFNVELLLWCRYTLLVISVHVCVWSAQHHYFGLIPGADVLCRNFTCKLQMLHSPCRCWSFYYFGCCNMFCSRGEKRSGMSIMTGQNQAGLQLRRVFKVIYIYITCILAGASYMKRCFKIRHTVCFTVISLVASHGVLPVVEGKATIKPCVLFTIWTPR